jgi:hypothetical protein
MVAAVVQRCREMNLRLSSRRLSLAAALCVGITVGPSTLYADPVVIAIDTPKFLIPLAGQTGSSLTVYSDGTAADPDGPFNALGSQSFTLVGGSNCNSSGWCSNPGTSSGDLTLNLVFTGSLLGAPFGDILSAVLQFSLYDFDFVTDHVTQQITLKEMAVLTQVNDTWLPVGDRINLANYVAAGIQTDDRYVTLAPISLYPDPLSDGDFTNPMTLSITLSAVAKNYGSQSVSLINTPEKLVSGLTLSLTPTQVPEPSTFILFGFSAAAIWGRRRVSRRVNSTRQ